MIDLNEMRSLLAEGVEMRSPTEDEVLELRKYCRSLNAKISVKQHKTAKGVTAEVRGPYGKEWGPKGETFVNISQWLVNNGWVQWPEGDTGWLDNMRNNATKYDAFYDIGLLMKRGRP